MSQIVPWVNTLCSYNATSFPSAAGVKRSNTMVFDGRLPSNTRCGTSQSGVPSALTCSRVFPKASASVCANTLASIVDRMKPFQHRAEVVGADREHGRQTDSGVHGVAPADPVPELEHVGGVDAEFC